MKLCMNLKQFSQIDARSTSKIISDFFFEFWIRFLFVFDFNVVEDYVGLCFLFESLESLFEMLSFSKNKGGKKSAAKRKIVKVLWAPKVNGECCAYPAPKHLLSACHKNAHSSLSLSPFMHFLLVWVWYGYRSCYSMHVGKGWFFY